MYFPYLKYGCSLEINTARTAAYLAARCEVCTDGMQGSVDLRHSCDILNFELDPTDGETVIPAVYTIPAADAPWVDASEPESARFLGFAIENVTKPHHVERTVTPKISGSGGGVIEAQRSGAQQLDFEVILFACDEVSMEYGMRYLTNGLIGGGCEEPCTLCELEYRDSCPSFVGATPTLEEYNVGRWILKNVGVTRSPEWSTPPVEGMGHYVRRAKFSLASEYPWKFTCSENCVTDATFDLPVPTLGCGADFDTFFCGQTSASCAVSEPSVVGETGFLIEIQAGKTKPLGGIEIQIIPDEWGWVCDPDSAPSGFVDPDPCDLVYVEDLPKNYKLMYNTATEEIWVITNAGVVQDGTPYLSFDGVGGPPSYPVVRCGEFCVKIVVDECSVSDGAGVTIDTIHREF